MVYSFSSKKGVSMVELLAYIALYGVVMSLLATLVYVLLKTTRKINRQAVLNRGTKLLYTEFLSQSISFNPDWVEINEPSGNTVSITLQKRFKYNDDGERIEIVPGDTEYANKPVKMIYSYTKGDDEMHIQYVYLNGTVTNALIDLDFGTTISSVDNDDVSNLFTIVSKSSISKSLVFNGKLTYDKKDLEFKFVVPIFVVNAD